jgi:hypothetical protein
MYAVRTKEERNMAWRVPMYCCSDWVAVSRCMAVMVRGSTTDAYTEK